jgi:hypothetical protein
LLPHKILNNEESIFMRVKYIFRIVSTLNKKFKVQSEAYVLYHPLWPPSVPSMRNRWITTIRDLIRPRGKRLGGLNLTADILLAAILDSGRIF